MFFSSGLRDVAQQMLRHRKVRSYLVERAVLLNAEPFVPDGFISALGTSAATTFMNQIARRLLC